MKCTICNKESDKLVDWIPKECIVFIHLKYYNAALKQDILHMATKEFINLLQNKFERRKENVHGN